MHAYARTRILHALMPQVAQEFDFRASGYAFAKRRFRGVVHTQLSSFTQVVNMPPERKNRKYWRCRKYRMYRKYRIFALSCSKYRKYRRCHRNGSTAQLYCRAVQDAINTGVGSCLG
eukprot:6187173-Pleurochrysis_carterae.AAC.1